MSRYLLVFCFLLLILPRQQASGQSDKGIKSAVPVRIEFISNFTPYHAQFATHDAYGFLIDRRENIDYCDKFYVLLLNRASKVQGVAFISEGSVGGTVADPKKIFQIAQKANAPAIILAQPSFRCNTAISSR